MEHQIVINISEDFSDTPGGRYRTDGDFSGEEFRQTVLLPKFREALAGSSILTVILDGVAGYATSFLEEAFGGLVRDMDSKDKVSKHLRLVSQNPIRIREVESYIHDAEQEKAA